MPDEGEEELVPEGMIFFGRRDPKRRDPESQNPEDYARSVKISDDECLLNLAHQSSISDELRRVGEEVARLQERAEVLEAQLRAKRAELFYALRRRYPEVASGGRVGWRYYEGEYYFVGWDER